VEPAAIEKSEIKAAGGTVPVQYVVTGGLQSTAVEPTTVEPPMAAEKLPPVPPAPVPSGDPPVAVTVAPPVAMTAAPPVPAALPPLPIGGLLLIADELQPTVKAANANHSNPIPEIHKARRIDMV
jgi:hypothetical protein